MARKTSASMYQTIEAQRCADVFYGLMFNETVKLNIFQNTLDILKKQIKHKSNRLKYAFNQIEKSNNPTLQHTLICFAITQDENVLHYIINHYPADSTRKKEVQDYIQHNLTTKTHNLLNGEYRSIVEYIDDVRASIAIELGFE